MKPANPKSLIRLGAAAALVVGLLALALPVLVRGDDGPARETVVATEVEPALPEGLVPATEHEVVIVPSAPEDPDAPAETFADPEPGPGGDESANRPIPDYLKGNPYRLSFLTGDYAPPEHERIDPLLVTSLGRNGRDYTYGYVMFEGAIQARKVRALEALGVAFGNYHTFNCLQACIPGRAIAGLRVSPFVRWVGCARPEQKVDEFILKELMNPRADPTEELTIYVNVFASDLCAASKPVPIDAVEPPVSTDPKEVAMRATVMMSNGPFQQALQAEGARVMGYEDSIQTFYVRATGATVRRLTELDFVAAMDMAFPPTLDHDRSMRLTEAAYLGGQSSYSGKDTSVAIVDSGFHHDHSDLSQTYVIGWDYSGEGNMRVDDLGHGTHVAGTVFGDGSARSDRRYRGSAPLTGTVITHPIFKLKILTKNNTYGPGWPNYGITAWSQTTQNQAFSGTTAQKCTVVQNSWGSGDRLSTGYYGTDTLSRGCDTNTHSYRQLYVMSSGNKGGSSTTIYFKSNRPPAVAKSAFAVGSVIDYDDTGGTLANRYPGAHRFSSSKGPTRDGRTKPQISAPGCCIVSALTNSTTLYTSKSGTSMSAPHVSGIAASMHDGSTAQRDYPCLCRALLMAGAAPYGDLRTWTTTSESYYNRRGMGQVDAYHLFSRPGTNGWSSGYAAATLKNTSAGFYFDVSVPSTAIQTFFMMSWDEKAPALNATKALLYNLDLVLDVEPFDPDINKGEFTSRNTVENYDWYGNIATIGSVRGKKIRVKIPFLTRPTSSSEEVRVAVAYHIPEGDCTPALTTSLSAVPTKVKPGGTITATGTAVVPEYRANNVYMTFSRGSATVTTLEHTTRDGRTLDTNSVVSGSYDSKTNWTLGNISYHWATNHRSLVWTLKAPSTNGTFSISATTRGDNCGSSSDSAVICVDGLAPNQPAKVQSTTHTVNAWTNNPSFTAVWAAASDNGCAGMAGYGIGMASSCPKIVSRNLGNVTTYSTKLPATSGSTWYFAIKSYDQVDNASGTTCIGPFLLDTVAPTGGTIAIESGASTTTTLTVSLNGLGATESGSGLYRMRFSNDGSTWSSWEAYAATRNGWVLSSYGGNASPGVKRVYVQYRDRAGNTSASYSDTITYSPVSIRNISPNRGTLIGRDLVDITGTGFDSTAIVYFGATRAPTVIVNSSTSISCRTPKHLVWEKVDVRVLVGTGSDTLTGGYEYVGARLIASGNPRIAVPFAVTFDAPVDGGKPYVGAASFGTGPIPLSPHGPLPLSADVLFFLTVGNQIPTVFANLQGVLNASGRAAGTVTLPNLPVIVGLDFHMAFATIDAVKPLGVRTVSSGRTFRIQS